MDLMVVMNEILTRVQGFIPVIIHDGLLVQPESCGASATRRARVLIPLLSIIVRNYGYLTSQGTLSFMYMLSVSSLSPYRLLESYYSRP